MTPEEEEAYIRGRRSAFQSLASEAARELDGPERELASMVAERAGAIEALRRLCQDLRLDGVDLDPKRLPEPIFDQGRGHHILDPPPRIRSASQSGPPDGL